MKCEHGFEHCGICHDMAGNLWPHIEKNTIEKNEISIDKLSQEQKLTFKINLTRQFKFRVYVATLLIKIAAFILGCKVEIK